MKILVLYNLTTPLSAIFFLLSISFSIAAHTESMTFKHRGETLSGHYFAPKRNAHAPKAVILFVHGDGPLNYSAHGYYPLIWDYLHELGYASFSWDKPGVGRSSGNWHQQSMEDRQAEVRAAIRFVRAQYGYTNRQIGLFGFSQAGWVVPAVANNSSDVGFVIGVGFAMNWQEQSWYITKTRLELEGKSQQQMSLSRTSHLEEITFLEQRPSYKEYVKKYGDQRKALSKQRFEFITKNFESDASGDYAGLRQPILILLGEDDLNVDIKNTYIQLSHIFQGRPNIDMHILPGASHSLLKSRHFGQQSPGFLFWLKLVWKGQNALTPEFLPILGQWLSELNLNNTISDNH